MVVVETGQNLILMGLTIIVVVLVTLVLVTIIFAGYMYLKALFRGVNLKALFRGVKERRYKNGRQ